MEAFHRVNSQLHICRLAAAVCLITAWGALLDRTLADSPDAVTVPASSPAKDSPAGTAESAPAAASEGAQPSTQDAVPASADPSTANTLADPADLKVLVEFRNQEWLPVLQWLAGKRKLNLDWQQLPEGTVNFSSTKEYRIEDAEDLINMQLLARGFTLLQRGEVLRLASLKNLDVTLVPRVKPEELATLPRHQFVRVTFPLDWMIAEEAAVEFKPLISPYGQLFPMGSSNKLEAIDAVVNLRELNRLLTQAEADEGRRERVVEFRLKHRKADDVALKVRQLLGLQAELPPAPVTQTQLDIEKMKFQSEAVKQLGAEAKPLLADKGGMARLVVNDKENSILVSGRPDKIELARQAIEAMDKPEPPKETSWETLNRVKVYDVTGFDPTTIVQLMQSLKTRGNLRSDTEIQHEIAYNRLVVVASADDQLTISKIIDGFRSEGRRAEVVSLGQIDAEYATKAIQLVLKNPARPAAAPGAASEGQFQIEPDPAHNRLLLWATPAETAEVRDFLARLGETFAGNNAAANMHVVRLHGAKTADVLRRLKKAWDVIGKVPLVIEHPPAEQPEKTPAPSDQPSEPAKEVQQESVPLSERGDVRIAALFAAKQQSSEAGAPAPPASTDSPATTEGRDPMSVRVITSEEDDDMIIVSRDPAAANSAKEFVKQIVPDEPAVRVITLKHAQAAQVKFLLDTLLLPISTGDISALYTRPAIRIEADSRINRLMIQDATPRQMALIDQLIPILDQPTQEDERLIRQQRIYRARHKRASEIVTVVKEVYRDLLSTNDKVFDARISNKPFGYNQAMAATSRSPEYQGLLSVGSDDVGNIVVLSAPAYLMDELLSLVQKIDDTGTGESMAVVPVSRAAQAALGEALGRLLAKP